MSSEIRGNTMRAAWAARLSNGGHGVAARAAWLLLALLLSAATARAQSNAPSLILSVSNVTTNEDEAAGPFAFTVTNGDDESDDGVEISRTTSDGSIVALAGITFPEDEGTNRTVLITPRPNAYGEVTIGLIAEDADGSVTATVDVVFLAVNDPPTIGAIADQTIAEDANTGWIAFTVADVDTDDTPGSLLVSGSSSDQDLVPDDAIAFGGSGGNRTVRVTPLPDANGACDISVVVSDGELTATNTFELTVEPRDDPPTITGDVTSPIPDNIASAIFASLTIADVDHQAPDNESLSVTAGVLDTGLGTFTSGATYETVGFPGAVTTALRGLAFEPAANSGPADVPVFVRVTDGDTTVSNRYTVSLYAVNDPPIVHASLSPSNVMESAWVEPFRLTIDDNDSLDDDFTVTVALADPGDAVHGTLNPANPRYVGSMATVQTAVQGIRYTAGSVGDDTAVAFDVVVEDGDGAKGTNTVTLTIVAVNELPEISGVSQTMWRTTDDPAAPPITPFPSVTITDNDPGQTMTVTLTLDDPAKGVLSETNFVGSVTEATTWIRGVTFTANQLPGRVIGAVENCALIIRVDDGRGGTRVNDNTTVAITAVNGTPRIGTVPDAIAQPFPVSPAPPIKPFAAMGVYVTDDGTNALTGTLALDDAAKGELVLTNLTLAAQVGFEEDAAVPGAYHFSGDVATMNQVLSNCVYVVSPSFQFPPDAPGGTTFEITMVDSVLNRASRELAIILQQDRRNLLVTEPDDGVYPNDYTDPDERGRPRIGTLRRAILEANNGDVITFALPAYPATIRLDPDLGAMDLLRGITIKGPGADMLTLSGDGNADGVPDTRIFNVYSWVTIDSIRMANAKAATGGALYVGTTNAAPGIVQTGNLTLRSCVIEQCEALQWGGALDVDGGSVTANGCLFRANTTDTTLGLGGGAVSLWTDEACTFVNCTFAANRQAAPSGFGGGAVYAENRTVSTELAVTIKHVTFAENTDASDQGSALSANAFGTRFRVMNSVFADATGRNLWVQGAGEILSDGGNIAADETRAVLTQGGNPQEVILLDEPDDRTSVDPRLMPFDGTVRPVGAYPPRADSPVVGAARGTAVPIDQRGVVRDGDPDSGAIEHGTAERILINEFLVDEGGTNAFVELYVPRDADPFALSGYRLIVDGQAWGAALTNGPIEPGDGVVLGDGTLDLKVSGRIELQGPGAGAAVLDVAYVASFVDPHRPSNTTWYANNSLTLAPQFRGAAYVPHSTVGNPPLGGVDLAAAVTTGGSVTSPGADSGGTPFGSPNGFPAALDDTFVVDEDRIFMLDVLANDLDADRYDTLVVVDISRTGGEGGDDAVTNSPAGALLSVAPLATPLRGQAVSYNPRLSAEIQALAAGDSMTDTFYYTILDIDTNGVPKAPTARSEARVNLTVLGLNDPPLPVGDSVPDVTETSVVRVMALPDLAGSTTAEFPSDGTYPVVPVISPTSLLANDLDPDHDDEGTSLTLFGVAGAVTAVADYSGTVDASPVTVTSTNHGLTAGDVILVAGYAGHASYNGLHAVGVIDADRFTLPVVYVDNVAEKGGWAAMGDPSRYAAVSRLGAEVTLELRQDPRESSLVYNPRASAYLDGLAAGETQVDTFYYAVLDSHGAAGLGVVTIPVAGVNDLPQPMDDPNDLALAEAVRGATALDEFLAGLDIVYALPSASGVSGRVDAQGLYTGIGGETNLLLGDLWFTDEDTPLLIAEGALLANDSDVDRLDVLSVGAVAPTSHLGGAVSLQGGGQVLYDPRPSARLNSLARGEWVLDTLSVTITDNAIVGAGAVTTRVAVVVEGRNDTPQANDDAYTTPEDVVRIVAAPGVTTNDVLFDHDGHVPDNALLLAPISNGTTTVANVRIDITGNTLTYDPTQAAFLDGLAQGTTYTDTFEYVVHDGSFLFAADDVFELSAGSTGIVLDVLANDVNLNTPESPLFVSDVAAPDVAGALWVGDAGAHVVYSPPPDFSGEALFAYTARDGLGRADTARVRVKVVRDSVNGDLRALPDRYRVARGETVTLDVLANDGFVSDGGSGLALDAIVRAPDVGGAASVSGGRVSYTPAPGAAGPYPYLETFAYTLSGGGTAVATGQVAVTVMDRRGMLDVNDDRYSVDMGATDVLLDVLANDRLRPGAAEGWAILDVTPADRAVLSGDGVLYTPSDGFVGVDTLRYVASDGVGGTGTGTVQVTVGTFLANNDAYTVETNATAVLDVLANDRIEPHAPDNIAITTVMPTNMPGLGSFAVGPGGRELHFSAAGSAGTVTGYYAVASSGGSVVTGRVAVTVTADIESTVARGDAFTVYRDSANNALDVLANDGFASRAGQSLSVLSVGTGIEGPDQGGTVTLNAAADGLVYTPAPGFSGEETFTYTMTDVAGTATATVVVRVEGGRLRANDDAWAVLYAQPGGGALTHTLPVLANDTAIPNFGQALSVVGVGIDAVASNAPNRQGEVTIAPDGQALLYTPSNSTAVASYQEHFTYEISDGTFRRAAARVAITVRSRTNALDNAASADAFAVRVSSVSNVLDVLANDGVLPAGTADWTLDGIVQAPTYGEAEVAEGAVIYTPTPGFAGVDTLSYAVRDALGGTGVAAVEVQVGPLPVVADHADVLSGTVSNRLDVLANDRRLGDAATYPDLLDVDASAALGTAVASGQYVYYTPPAAYAGVYPFTDRIGYRVVDDTAGPVTSRVDVTVHEAGSDRDTATVFMTVTGVNDLPVLQGAAGAFAVTDRQTAAPLTNAVASDVDAQGLELLVLKVTLDDPSKGFLTNLSGFAEGPAGTYTLAAGPGAVVSPVLQGLVFVPVEHQGQVPLPHDVVLTVSATDPFGGAVTSAVVVAVTPLNDAPTISGAVAAQRVHERSTIEPFAEVTVGEVDDRGLQPLIVTVALDEPTQGYLTALGGFVGQGNGVYTLTGKTAAEATAALRAMIFVPTTGDRLPPGGSERTRLTITVDDGFAVPVVDANTTVFAVNAFSQSMLVSDRAEGDQLGFSVVASRSLVAAGAPFADVGGLPGGAVYLFESDSLEPEIWTETYKLSALDAGTGDQFGRALGLDGNLLVVGAPLARQDGVASGAAYVFERQAEQGGDWLQIARLLPVASNGVFDAVEAARFGTAAAIEGDTVVIGATGMSRSNNVCGVVYVFDRHAGGSNTWGLVRKLMPENGETDDRFGVTTAIRDGLLAVGASRDDTMVPDAGAVYLYARDEGGSNQWGQVQVLVAEDGDSNDGFGNALCLGDRFIGVGAPCHNADGVCAGAVYMYGRDPDGTGAWTRVGEKLTAFDGEDYDQFGWSVSIDNAMVVVGAQRDTVSERRSGSAYVFAESGFESGQWRFLDKLLPLGAKDILTGQDRYGYAVALQDGTLAIGGPDAVREGIMSGIVDIYGRFVYEFEPASNRFALAVDSLGAVDVPLGFDPPDDYGAHGGQTPVVRTYVRGSVVGLDAPLTMGQSHLIEWIGVDAANGAQASVTVDTNRQVWVRYAPVHELTIAVEGPDAVALRIAPLDYAGEGDGTAPLSRDFPQGTEVALAAPASVGDYRLAGWDGVDAATGTHATVTMAAARSVTVRYEPIYTLTVEATGTNDLPVQIAPLDDVGDGDGVTPLARAYTNGTRVTLTAPAAVGNYRFHGWLGADDTDGLEAAVTLRSNRLVRAEYLPVYTLDVVSTGTNGVPVTVTPVDDGGQADGTTPMARVYLAGTAVTLTVPETYGDWVFSEWTGVDTAAGVQAVVTVDAARTATAVYLPKPVVYTLRVTSTGGDGIPIAVVPADRDGLSDGVTPFTRTYAAGSDVALTAPLTRPNLVLEGWVGVDGATGTGATVRLDGNRDVTAAYTVIDPQEPYGGIAWAIPGTIQFENYDEGGPDIAYVDSTPINQGGAYRPQEQVDIEAYNVELNGFAVTDTMAGEWLEYAVNVQTTGLYVVDVRVAMQGAGGTFHLELDGQDISGPMQVPDSGGTFAWVEVSRDALPMRAGQHGLRVVMDVEGANGYVGAFDSMRFAYQAGPTVRILDPELDPVYVSETNTTALSGIATGNQDIVSIVVSNTQDNATLMATGVGEWSVAGVPLFRGRNTITVTAVDVQGQSATDTVVVNYVGGEIPWPNHVTIEDRRPIFAWAAAEGATWYHLWIGRDGVKYHDEWIKGDTLWTPVRSMQGGTYHWWIQPWGPAGFQPWSARSEFVVVTRPPEKVALHTPTGVVAVARPTFAWEADDNATWYRLWVNHNDTGYIDQWIKGAASHVPEQDLPLGLFSWWVRPWGPDGYGPWSDAARFSYGLTEPIAPKGDDIGTREPEFRWRPADGATWYQLRVYKDGALYREQWVEGATAFTFDSPYPYGHFEWWVRAWNQDGYGPWSVSADFYIGRPSPVAPIGAVALPTETLVWDDTPCTDASWYAFWMRRDGERYWSQWVPRSETEDAGGGARRFSLPVPPPPGAYTWWMRAWNETDQQGPWSEGAAFQQP